MASATLQPKGRAACLLKWLLLLGLSLGVSACGGGNTPNTSSNQGACDNPPHVETAVDMNLDTFDVKVADFPHTVFQDYFKAIQPNKSDSAYSAADDQMAQDIVTLLQPITSYSGAATSYTSTRTPYDLLDYLVATDAVANFDAGRSLAVTCAVAGMPYDYNNDAVVFRDTSNSTEASGYKDWVYVVRWAVAPSTGLIVRSFSVAAQLDKSSGVTQNISVATNYDEKNFDSTGYNPPQARTLLATQVYSDKSKHLVSFEQRYTGSNTDTLNVYNYQPKDNALPPPFTFNGDTKVQCVHAVLDYSIPQITFYVSDKPETDSDESCMAASPDPKTVSTYTYKTDPTAAASRQ